MKGNKIPAMSGAEFCKKLQPALKNAGIDFEITKNNRLVFNLTGQKISVSIGRENIQSSQIKQIVHSSGISIAELLGNKK